MEQQSKIKSVYFVCLKDKHVKAGGIFTRLKCKLSLLRFRFISCVMYVHSQTLLMYALCDDNLASFLF